MTVAVRARTDRHVRIVAALAAHPRCDEVIVVGRPVPRSWGEGVRQQEDTTGAGVVVDPEPADGGVHVTGGSALGGPGTGIVDASPEGLARALATRLDTAEAAWTVPGERQRQAASSYPFPSPVGVVRGTDGRAPVGGDFAAAGAFTATATIAVVDDLRFLEAVCLAAGALVALPAPRSATPVWERAEEYIVACEQLGVVVAEAG